MNHRLRGLLGTPARSGKVRAQFQKVYPPFEKTHLGEVRRSSHGSLVSSGKDTGVTEGGCGHAPPLRLWAGWGRWGCPRKGYWLHLQEFTGQSGAGQAGGISAGPQCWGCLEKLNKYLLSVPSTEGRELLGLRAFISGALAFSLAGATGTKQVTTNISWQLPKETSRGSISMKIPPQPK